MDSAKPFSEKALLDLLTGLAGQESYVFLESTRLTQENHCSYLFLDPVDRLVCEEGDDPGNFFIKAEDCLQQGYFLSGYIGYEFGYLLEPSLKINFIKRESPGSRDGRLPLADLGVFPTPLIYDHQLASFMGDKPRPELIVPGNTGAFSIENLGLNLEKEEYLKAIKSIKDYIASGDTYQVNYTLKLLFDFAGSINDFYCSLRRNQSVSYSGLIKNGDTSILTFSPELFFRKKENQINVRPMKGTMLRGRTSAEDMELARFLHHDIKNRSENVMIVDLLRNDLGRLSRMGGVNVQSLFDVETYETLHQMTSSIRGELNRTVSLEEMFKALFPCGSVTGAPKIRTMEIIRELESEDRGVYTGAIGYISPTGEAVFNVPIRTVVLQGRKGEMGIGSGIVWDSDPVDEWEECKLKGRFLTSPAPEFKLIETMLWRPVSGYWLLEIHLRRLAESAGYFFYPMDTEKIKTRLLDFAAEFSRENSVKCQRVRLTLSKAGEVDIVHTELPDNSLPIVDPIEVLKQKGQAALPEVVFSDKYTDSNSIYLFHKTTERKLYDDERALTVAEGYYEVLFVNEKGEVTEGSYTNIFLQKGNKLLTPPVSCGLLPGVLRNHLLQEFPEIVQEEIFTIEDIEQAEAVYVGNSVRGLVKVRILNL